MPLKIFYIHKTLNFFFPSRKSYALKKSTILRQLSGTMCHLHPLAQKILIILKFLKKIVVKKKNNKVKLNNNKKKIGI